MNLYQYLYLGLVARYPLVDGSRTVVVEPLDDKARGRLQLVRPQGVLTVQEDVVTAILYLCWYEQPRYLHPLSLCNICQSKLVEQLWSLVRFLSSSTSKASNTKFPM